MFGSSLWRLAAGGVFLVLLAGAALCDLRTRRIPNRLVVVLGVVGLVFSSISLAMPRGLVYGGSGVLVGFALWTPLYALKVLGAGDVKLFAASAAWLGPLGALEAALFSMLAGGLVATVYVLWRGQGPVGRAVSGLALLLPPKIAALTAPQHDGPALSLPYGVALAVGAAVAGWYPGLFG